MADEKHPDLLHFEKLKKVIADSSSLIYMRKAGFLDHFLTSLENARYTRRILTYSRELFLEIRKGI